MSDVDGPRQPDVFRFFAYFVGILLATIAAFIALSLYEWAFLGEQSLGIGKPPLVTVYYIGRFALALLLSLLMAAGLYRLRSEAAGIQRHEISGLKGLAAYSLLTAATAFTVLFAVDPVLFYEVSLEDGALEWTSALIPLASSGAFIFAFALVRRSERRDDYRRVALVFTPLFAAALFVIGMEEISWMQRVFDIETPELFAENQQHEMNLHNMHSIIIGSTHKMMVFAGLVMLPFIAETAPKNYLFDLLADFIPSRFVLAVSAPLAAFHYNEWNFFPSPITVTITLVILACYAKAAWDRRDRAEIALFGAIAVFVVIAQSVFLMLGANFVRMWDAAEYMELFMAIGLGLFTAETTARLAARYGAPRIPFDAIPAGR
jgi:hypothetical protein